MATPTSPERRLHARGSKKGATWGTAVALGAGNGVLLNAGSGLHPPKAPYVPALESDTPFVKEGDLGNYDPVDITLPFDARYDPGQLGTLFSQLFGIAGAPTQQGATTAYKHVLQWDDEISGKFSTWVEERAGKIFEVASAKPMTLEFSVADALLKGALTLRGNTVIQDSGVNTATQIDALTYKDIEHRIRMRHGTVKMNAESGGDVASESALQVNDLTVSFARSLDGEHIVGDEKIIEPLEDAHPVVTVTINFPRMNTVNDAYFASYVGETEQKMLIKFEGVIIESTYKYTLALFFPRLRFLSPEYPDDEITKGSFSFQAEQASTNPTGMDHARPYIEMINTRTTDYLA